MCRHGRWFWQFLVGSLYAPQRGDRRQKSILLRSLLRSLARVMTLAPRGPVEIATTGQWTSKIFGLTGGSGPNFNHAKLGVSTSGNDHYSIFGDMSQQGAASGERCSSSQNGRGGLFYVINDPVLFDNLKQLISGSTAPTASTP